MQFGMDQDIPGSVTRMNDNAEIAWEYYFRPITDSNVYIPSRFFEPDVTTRYVEWWKKSVWGYHDPVQNLVKRKRSQRLLKKRCYATISPPPGFPPNARGYFPGGPPPPPPHGYPPQGHPMDPYLLFPWWGPNPPNRMA